MTPSLLQVLADGSSDQSLIVEIVVSSPISTISWPAVITVTVLCLLLACHGHLATQGVQQPTRTSSRSAATALLQERAEVDDAGCGSFFFDDMASHNEAGSSQLESCVTLGEGTRRDLQAPR